MTICDHCQSTFKPRLQAVGGRAQRYCSPTCRKMAHKARAAAPDKRHHASPVLSDGSNVTTLHTPAIPAPLKALNGEWLDLGPDFHRSVAGRQNKAETTLREWALGMDRAPIGHAVLVAGQWLGKVRHNGVVVWTSAPLATADEAKRAVLVELAGRPEVIASALKVATREAMPLRASASSEAGAREFDLAA